MPTYREAPPLSIRLVGGVETKADPKTVSPPKLLGLENGIFTRALSIAKRHGYDALSTAVLGSSASYSDSRGLGVRGDELVQFTRDRCYSYVEGAAKWSDVGSVMSVGQTDRALAKTTAEQTAGDYAAVSGIGVTAWEDSRGGVYYAIVEDNEGRITYGPIQATATGSRPRCVRCGAKLAILWAEPALGQVKVIMVDPDAPDAIDKDRFPGVLITDLVVANPNFDAVYGAGQNIAYVAWNSTIGVRVGILDSSGVIGSPATGWASPATDAAHLGSVTVGPVINVQKPFFQDNLVVAYATSLQVYYTDYFVPSPDSLSILSGPVSIGYGAGASMLALATRYYATADELAQTDIYIESRNVPARDSLIRRITVEFDGGTVVSSTTVFRGCALASRAFVDYDETLATEPERERAATSTFVNVIHQVPLFGVYMTLRHDGLVVARMLPGVAGNAPLRKHLPSVIGDGERGYRWTAIYKTALNAVNDDQFTEAGLRLIALDFDQADAWQTVQAGRCLYLGGAVQHVYDGLGWVEASFHYAPDWDAGSVFHTNSTDSGGLDAGTRDYVFVPEYTLATGEVIRGPTSKPYAVTIGAGEDTTTFDAIPTIRHTRMAPTMQVGRADVRIGVYRTTKTVGGVYYRVSSLNPNTVGDFNGYVANSIDLDSVTFIDQMSDATLILQEELYTNGGILANDPTPSTAILASGNGRIFWTDPSDTSVVRFSQVREDGYTLEVAPKLRVALDPGGGAITAIAVMDGKIIVFKRSAIYLIAGPGPLPGPDLGGPSDAFSEPQLITTDCGCVSQRSIAATPDGLVFKSAKGVYLLNRSLQVAYVGASVEAYNDQDITRATLVDDTTQVRFLTSSGRTLLFDYQVGQWSLWTNHEGLDAAIVDGVYHYLRTDGRVFREDATGYDDDGSAIKLVIETAWIRFQETLQGWQKYWRLHALGTWKSAHSLRFQYALGYAADGDWSNPIDVDWSTPGGSNYGEGNYGEGNYGGTPNDAYQTRWHLDLSGQAIRFRFEDVEAEGSRGAAFELTELLLTGAIKRSSIRPLPSNRSA